MGGACGTYGRQERFIQDFWWTGLVKRDNFENVCIEGRIIL